MKRVVDQHLGGLDDCPHLVAGLAAEGLGRGAGDGGDELQVTRRLATFLDTTLVIF
jgi:hypothetical protein